MKFKPYNLLLLTFGILFLISSEAYAQAPKNKNNQKTDPKADKSKQTSATMRHGNKYLFNRDAKKWSVGGQAGTSLFHGDADKTKFQYSFGGNVKYNFSHVFSTRAVFNVGQFGGSLSKPGDRSFRFYEFNTAFAELSIQGIYTIGNISFLKKQSRWNFFVFGGIGGLFNRPKADWGLVSNPTSDTTFSMKRWNVLMTFGVGVKYNVNKSIDIGLEYGMRWGRTDSFDILAPRIWPNRKFDFYSLPQVVLNFKIGKGGKEHLDWINPVSTVYEELTTIDEKINKLDKDSDNDGVADRFDKEPNTPAGAKVWGSGEAVDLDGDGIADVNDQEPNSPPGAKVDPNTGIAEDEDGDGVPDILDLSPGTDQALMVNHQGIPIMSKEMANEMNITNNKSSSGGGGGGMGGGMLFLPAVFFDSDVDMPYPTHLPDLQNIANAMKTNPMIKLEVIGNADQRASDDYNLRLAQRRADNVKKILVDFGVDPSRLITKTNGERVPISKGGTAYDLQANRRVQFFITH